MATDDRVVVEFDQHTPEYRESYPAQAHELRRIKVRMPRVAGDGTAEHVGRLAVARHAATGLVRERDDAVDIGIVIQPVFEMLRDHARHRGRAIHAGEDADVVTRRDAARI